LSVNKALLYLPFANKNEVFISKARGQGKKEVFISKGKLALLYFSHKCVKNITNAGYKKTTFFLLTKVRRTFKNLYKSTLITSFACFLRGLSIKRLCNKFVFIQIFL